MTAAATIVIALGAGPGGKQASSAPQTSAANPMLRDRWDAVFRSLSAIEVPPSSSAGPQLRIRVDDTPFRGPTNLAQPNAAPAGVKANADPPANQQKDEEKIAAAIEPTSNWRSKASASPAIPASTPIFPEDGNAQPAAPPAISAKHASAASGASDHGSDNVKTSGQSPSIDLAALSAAASFPATSPLSAAPSDAAKSGASASRVSSSRDFPDAGTSGPAGFGVRSGNFSVRETFAEGVPVSAGLVLPGVQTAQPNLLVSAESEAAALSDQGRSATGAGPLHAGEPDAAKPVAREVGLSVSRDSGATSDAWSAPTGQIIAPLTRERQAADAHSVESYWSAHTNEAPPVQMLAARDTAAKAKSPGGGEGIGAVGSAAAPAPSLAPGGTGAHTEVLVARESGTVPVAAQSAAPSGDAPASASKDAFAALDGAVPGAAPAWVHAGATRAEAGFEDPALGWVGVRAELGNGGVHASLVPGSTDAELELGSHLAGLNAYLAEHHAGVSAVTLSSTENRSPDAGSGQAGAGHQEFGQPAQQGSGDRQETNSRAGDAAEGATGATAAVRQSVNSPGAVHAEVWTERRAGARISVLA